MALFLDGRAPPCFFSPWWARPTPVLYLEFRAAAPHRRRPNLPWVPLGWSVHSPLSQWAATGYTHYDCFGFPPAFAPFWECQIQLGTPAPTAVVPHVIRTFFVATSPSLNSNSSLPFRLINNFSFLSFATSSLGLFVAALALAFLLAALTFASIPRGLCLIFLILLFMLSRDIHCT